MSSVRKRGKSWNAQVRISGWRSFTKTFSKKSDAVRWSKDLENKLLSSSLPETNIKNLKLKDLLQRYAKEISPTHKGGESEIYRLNAISRSWLGDTEVIDLTKYHFIQFREDRLKNVSSGTAKIELMLIKRVFKVSQKNGDMEFLIIQLRILNSQNHQNQELEDYRRMSFRS